MKTDPGAEEAHPGATGAHHEVRDVPHGVVDAYPSTDGDGQPGVVCDRPKAMVAHNGGWDPPLSIMEANSEAVWAKMRAIEAVLTFAAVRTISMFYVKSISNIG
jgi:hypothetical protein